MNARLLRLIAFAFPLWGTALGVGLIVLFNREAVFALVVGVGTVLVLVNGIWLAVTRDEASNNGAWCLGYLFGSAVVVLISGLFLLCMRQCN
jgi:hypothetical protein